jgi:hypothetical protein
MKSIPKNKEWMIVACAISNFYAFLSVINSITEILEKAGTFPFAHRAYQGRFFNQVLKAVIHVVAKTYVTGCHNVNYRMNNKGNF